MTSFAANRLEEAFRDLLGESFEQEFRELVEAEAWYHGGLEAGEVFRLWVIAQVERAATSEWVFGPIRPSERKFLCDHIGIPRNDIIGKSPVEVAEQLMKACGIPVPTVWGYRTERAEWQKVIEWIQGDQDAHASVRLRQLSERFLRRNLHYYVSTGLGPEFVHVLDNPGSMRLPKKLDAVMGATGDRAELIADLLTEDGWTELGFLVIALRKLAKRVENVRSRPLFTADEQKTFEDLAKALQAYTHDNPSRLANRKNELDTAARRTQRSVYDMINRQVTPDELLVLETGEGAFGYVFRGVNDQGQKRALLSRVAPPRCRGRVLFVATANCDYAQAEWVHSPWPVR